VRNLLQTHTHIHIHTYSHNDPHTTHLGATHAQEELCIVRNLLHAHTDIHIHTYSHNPHTTHLRVTLVQEELCIVRNLLQRARFDPSPDHAAVMTSFRDGELCVYECVCMRVCVVGVNVSGCGCG